MLNIIPDWDAKKSLNLRNHYEPILLSNQKIICDECGKRHFPDEETFIVIYGNLTVNFAGGIVGNNFTQDGKLFRAAVYCRSKQCIGNLLSRLIENEDDSEIVESDPNDELSFENIMKKFEK